MVIHGPDRFSFFQVGFIVFHGSRLVHIRAELRRREYPKRYPFDLYLGPTILPWPSDDDDDDDANLSKMKDHSSCKFSYWLH